tara:strand:+ start:155 stop:553 length:399 start_codon:yes stop_codon:yes gene_type:complete
MAPIPNTFRSGGVTYQKEPVTLDGTEMQQIRGVRFDDGGSKQFFLVTKNNVYADLRRPRKNSKPKTYQVVGPADTLYAIALRAGQDSTAILAPGFGAKLDSSDALAMWTGSGAGAEVGSDEDTNTFLGWRDL